MWSKEVWESRWRVPILNGIGWTIAGFYPLLFRVIARAPVRGMPASVTPLLHYPHFAYTWFGQDLPELLLVYAVIWCIGSIAREWQTGTVEFLAQLPLKPRQIAWNKGLCGMAELGSASIASSAVLWVASLAAGHPLAWGPYALSVLLMTVGFIGILWLLSWVAWALHSIYAVIIGGVGLFAISAIAESVPQLKRFSLLTYVSNTTPHPQVVHVWEHLGIVAVVSGGLAIFALWAASRQEFVPQHGRDQI